MANIKIFIASSAEVKDERDRALHIIEHLNQSHKHLELKVVEWEYVTIPGSQPGYGNIQEAINPRLEESQIAAFIFYSKIGKYTRQEFEYAISADKKLFVLFRTEFSPKTKEHIKAFEELIDFKESLNDRILHIDYGNLEAFEKYLYKSLNQYLTEKYPASEIISTDVAVVALSQTNQQLIQMLGEKDLEIKKLNEQLLLKPNNEGEDQLQKLVAEQEAIQKQLRESEEIIRQQIKDKEILEEQLTLQKDKDILKAKALEEVEKGNYAEAEGYLKQSAKDSIDETASTFYELAKIKKLQFQYADALGYCELAVKVNSDNSLYLNDAGTMANDLGFYDKAIEFYEKSLTIDKNIHGEEHSDIAIKYSNLGIAYNNKGEYDKAIEFHQKAMAIYKKLLGEEHPDNAVVYNNIGLSYHDKGEYDKAIKFYQKSITIGEKTYPDGHPNIAIRYNNLGATYTIINEFDKAITFYEKALLIDKKFFGEEHPNIAMRYNNLGLTYDRKGLYDKAIEFHQKALAIYKKFFGEEHPSIAVEYSNLASAYDSKGEYDNAIGFYEKALSIGKKFLGENHPNIAIRYNNLGFAFYHKGEYHKAIEFYKKALSIGRKFLSPNHPFILDYLENLKTADTALNQQQKKKPGKK